MFDETYKIPSFDVQTYHLISARQPDLVIVNGIKNTELWNFPLPTDDRVKLMESEKRNKYLDHARELKKIDGTYKW